MKLFLTCRIWILSDKRVKGLFEEKESIVVLDDKENKLSDDEKWQIFKKHNANADLPEKQQAEILKTVIYFPLLCKLFAGNKHLLGDELTLFREPIEVVKKEIETLKVKDAIKYCCLVCLVFYNDTLCLTYFTKHDQLFRKCLNLCGLPEYTAPAIMKANLELLEGYFVKKIGDTYHFYHDFVMEVTTLVFGKDYPVETIEYADIGFLRRRVRLENCSDLNDPFIISLSEKHMSNLVERYSNEIVGDRFMEVVLSPCLRDEKLIDLLIEKLDIDWKKILLIQKNN